MTLLATTDELQHILEDEAGHIDLDGIPAPWPRLLNFDNTSTWIETRFNDVFDARDRLDAFNENAIEKLLTKATNEEKQLRKLLTKMKKHHETAILKSKADNFLDKIRQAHAEGQSTILTLSQYGTHGHHINLHLALEEAQQLLDDINTISSRGENARKVLLCANESLQFWSGVSDITSNQVIEASELKHYGIITKNRISDAIQLAHRAFDTMTKAESTISYNRRHYDALLLQHKRIFGLQAAIRDTFNNSIVPQTDTMFEMIQDNHNKVQQDMGSLQRLRQIVNEVNERCHEGLHYIRMNYLDAARVHSQDLTLRAREYAKLFQHSKNGAEVALLASSAHRNISEAIESARILAMETIEAVAKSEEELYPINGESVIEKGLHSLRKSQKIEEDAIKELNKMQGTLSIFLSNNKHNSDNYI